MAKIKKEFLTPMWLEIKLMYETGTNGSDKYGTNFLINGELDKKSRNFVDHIGAFTREFGWDCIIEDVKMDLWKERIWSLIENAGLLPEIAWKDDLAKDLKIAEEEAEDDVWELNIEEIEKGIYGNL